MGEASLVKGNSKYIAFPWHSTGGGILAVVSRYQAGKIETDFPKIIDFQGQVTDFDFCPFKDNILAASSSDNLIRLFQIPESFTINLSHNQLELKGHIKKPILITFNPVSENVLASTAMDNTVKIWDIQKKGEFMLNMECPAQAQSLEWSPLADILGLTFKDKMTRILESRSSQFVMELKGHEGSKSAKFQWVSQNEFITTGFNKSQEREFSFIDMRNPGSPLQVVTIDKGVGVVQPFYDMDTGLLFLAAKGDSMIRSYELVEGKFIQTGDTFRSKEQGCGYGIFPKYTVNTGHCELMRFIKLTPKTIEQISFVQPRKSEEYQDDLYPDTISNIPAQSSEAWFAGHNAPPNKISLKHYQLVDYNKDVAKGMYQPIHHEASAQTQTQTASHQQEKQHIETQQYGLQKHEEEHKSSDQQHQTQKQQQSKQESMTSNVNKDSLVIAKLKEIDSLTNELQQKTKQNDEDSQVVIARLKQVVDEMKITIDQQRSDNAMLRNEIKEAREELMKKSLQ